MSSASWSKVGGPHCWPARRPRGLPPGHPQQSGFRLGTSAPAAHPRPWPVRECGSRPREQGPELGVLAGLYEIVQVEVACDERGGLAVRLVQQRLIPLKVARHLLKARALVEAVRPKRLHLLLRNFARRPFHAGAWPARSAAGVPGGARPPSAGSRCPGAACLRSPSQLLKVRASSSSRQQQRLPPVVSRS